MNEKWHQNENNQSFNEKDIAIMRGEICPYCGAKPELIDSAEIYNGTSYGPIYICRPCNAYVGVYENTNKPLGRLANAGLRELKKQAHEVFDKIWRLKYKRGRHQAYYWLSKQLKLPFDYTHIGMMDEDYCRKTIIICKQYLYQKDPEQFPEYKDT